MSKLWKTNWFRPVFFIALALGIVVVVVVLASPDKEEKDVADSSLMQTPEGTAVAALQQDKLTELDESSVDGASITETKSSSVDDNAQTDEIDEENAEEDGSASEEPEDAITDSNDNGDSNSSNTEKSNDNEDSDTSGTEEAITDSNDNESSNDTSNSEENTSDSNGDENSNNSSDTEENNTESSDSAVVGGDPMSGDIDSSGVAPDAVAMYKDPDHEETDPPQVVGAKWVNGEAVPMTVKEVDEFLIKVYATQTQEEYEALMDSIVYFNVGIDTTKLVWSDSYAG